MLLSGRGPVYEPKDSSFRPWNLITLIGFLIGRCLGRLFRKGRANHVAEED